MLKPLNDRVLLKMTEAEENTKGFVKHYGNFLIKKDTLNKLKKINKKRASRFCCTK